MRLGSGVAVALTVAGNYSSNWTPSLETSICHGCSPRKDKKKKKSIVFKYVSYNKNKFLKYYLYYIKICKILGHKCDKIHAKSENLKALLREIKEGLNKWSDILMSQKTQYS